ncbi:MAG: Fic family protein [Verrucomicrobiales bacterium]|nr:Fic family protein [Verrucomicrobiales bacterium]
MPKKIPEEEFTSIASVIAEFPEGVAISAIRERIALDLSLRTLQRRLERLEDAGNITSSGTGKGTRYFPMIPTVENQELLDGVIPLSARAREIRSHVLGPIGSRTPVGYDPDFLRSYVPNQTAYLSNTFRQDLARVGQVGVSGLPAGTYIRQVLHRLLIDLSWNSSRLEGNTYSLLETERLIHLGEGAEGKDMKETQMILNHKGAIEMLAEQAEEIGFNRYTICNLHALLSDNLLADPGACGRLRDREVGIGGSVFHPLAVPQQIEQRFIEVLEKADAIEDPFEQAFFAMVHLPYLQPFEDVNKRVSRLAANIPLVRHNLCPLSFIDVPPEEYIHGLMGIYELKQVDYFRDVFVWAYQRSAARYSAVLQSPGDPDPFQVRYRSEIKEMVAAIVKDGLDKRGATERIALVARAEIEEAKFIEVVETELLSLHEGSIARFRLRPSEFTDWKTNWK